MHTHSNRAPGSSPHACTRASVPWPPVPWARASTPTCRRTAGSVPCPLSGGSPAGRYRSASGTRPIRLARTSASSSPPALRRKSALTWAPSSRAPASRPRSAAVSRCRRSSSVPSSLAPPKSVVAYGRAGRASAGGGRQREGKRHDRSTSLVVRIMRRRTVLRSPIRAFMSKCCTGARRNGPHPPPRPRLLRPRRTTSE